MSLVHKVCSVGFSQCIFCTEIARHTWSISYSSVYLKQCIADLNLCDAFFFIMVLITNVIPPLCTCLLHDETNPLNILMQSLAYCYYFLSFDLSFNMQKPFSSQSSGNAFYCSFIAKINSPNSFFLAYTCTNTFVKETCFVS